MTVLVTLKPIDASPTPLVSNTCGSLWSTKRENDGVMPLAVAAGFAIFGLQASAFPSDERADDHDLDQLVAAWAPVHDVLAELGPLERALQSLADLLPGATDVDQLIIGHDAEPGGQVSELERDA